MYAKHPRHVKDIYHAYKNMNSIDELLDAAKTAINAESDNQLAVKIGVTRATISLWRHKKSTPDNYAIVQLAKLLGRSPMEILGIIEAEKAKTPERQEYWQDFLAGLLDTTKKLGVVAALTCASYTTGITKADATPLGARTSPAMYIMLNRQLRKLLKRLGFYRNALQP